MTEITTEHYCQCNKAQIQYLSQTGHSVYFWCGFISDSHHITHNLGPAPKFNGTI